MTCSCDHDNDIWVSRSREFIDQLYDCRLPITLKFHVVNFQSPTVVTKEINVVLAMALKHTMHNKVRKISTITGV